MDNQCIAMMRATWGWIRVKAPLALLGLALLIAVGCGGSKDKAAVSTGAGFHHPAGWIDAHPKDALANLGSCTICHETNVLKVGSGIPNCMTSACHHGTITGFAVPGLHGLQAKKVQDATGGGLASCQLCHGNDFQGGLSGVSCQSCHGVAAPHPHKPWNDATGLSHATTDPANGAQCAQCHFPGSPNNPPGHPATPAPAGTVPGCFSNTECHGTASAPHALGSVWTDATSSAFHGLQAKKDLSYCQSCHGTPGTILFEGGVAPTKCSTCHTAAKAHSTTWSAAPSATFPGYVASHRNAQNMATTCVICHDYTKGRVAPNPAAPSCFSATSNGVACHVNGPGQANHAIPFLATAHTAVTQPAFNADCITCHAVTGNSPLTAAPNCTVCHQAASPLSTGACASCHTKPPTGTAFPNVAASHAKHDALATVTGQCATCHNGFDSGSQAHYDHANARPGSDALRVAPAATAFLATFNAKTGAAAFNASAQTCSNVSCHGGVTTPSWAGGTIATTTDAGCIQCHAQGTAQGVPQNNSFYSGLHATHLGGTIKAACSECHTLTNGTPGALNHFKFLNTTQMEGPASDTVAPLGVAANYNKANQTCTVTCHGQTHTNYSWLGGANHPVPYLDQAHTTATQATFTSNCGTCHATTGTSPVAAAPLCTTCHQSGSPLTVTACASCHTKPPAGTVFPNVAGKHAKHDALTGVTGTCSACHTTFDSGTQAHYDHANARPGKDALRVAPGATAFLATYNAKATVAAFNAAAQTCSNVSCHGGIVTPSWATGTIAGTTDAGCRQCHTRGTALGTPQYNSWYSGSHGEHSGQLCTDCHVMTNGTTGANNHYKFLGTTQMEGPASDTVWPLGVASNYNVTAKTCTLTCHGENHNARRW